MVSPDEIMLVSDTQALALALERLRRAADAVLRAVETGGMFDSALSELESAHAASDHGVHSPHVAWAQDVLDGVVPVRKRKKTGRKPESFDTVRKSAAAHNIFVHFVNTFEGSQFAVYHNSKKVAHALTEKRCVAIMRNLIRADQVATAIRRGRKKK